MCLYNHGLVVPNSVCNKNQSLFPYEKDRQYISVSVNFSINIEFGCHALKV